eukprot:3269887-Pyramimonas_sp.AAC.1
MKHTCALVSHVQDAGAEQDRRDVEGGRGAHAGGNGGQGVRPTNAHKRNQLSQKYSKIQYTYGGEKWEKVGNWTQGEKRGRVSGVLCASLPLLAQEDL